MIGLPLVLVPITLRMFPCPACDGEPVNTINALDCRWSVSPDGAVEEWAGNDLDTQTTLSQDGHPILTRTNGHAYTHVAFTDEVMRMRQIARHDEGEKVRT